MRAGSANRDGLTPSKPEAHKRTHYARPGQVSFDERSYKLSTFGVESFGRLGAEGSDLIDQVTSSMVGGTDGSSLARKGVCKERLLQRMSVTTQLGIPAECNDIDLRHRQTARGRREKSGLMMPMTWGYNIDEEEE